MSLRLCKFLTVFITLDVIRRSDMSSKLFSNLLVFSLLLFLVCCKNDENRKPVSEESDMSNVREQSFQLSPEQIKELTDRVTTLKLGESKASILEIMGPPDDENFLIPKRSGVVEWTCSELIYYMTFDARRSGRNKNIHLVFDRQNKLIRIISAIEELKRGDIAPCR